MLLEQCPRYFAFAVECGWSLVFASTSVLRFLESVQNAVFQRVYPAPLHTIMVVS